MKRPRIKIELNGFDKILEALGFLILIGVIVYPFLEYASLPDRVPVHYDASGTPDRYGSKSHVWIIVILSSFLYIGMFFLNRFPHLFNFPMEITEENAERQYRLATKMIRGVNVIIVAGFFFINYQSIEVAKGNADGLGKSFLFTFLGSLTIGIVWYFIVAFKKPEKSN